MRWDCAAKVIKKSEKEKKTLLFSKFSCIFAEFFVPLRAEYFFKTTTSMKKVITLIIGLVCMSTIVLARTPQEAAQIASQFISQSHVAPVQRMQRAAAAQNMAKPVELVYTQYQVDATTPAVFVFNNQEAEGFVLVSAEDEARAILGYSDKGSFNQEDIPENMRFWLQMYADELAHYEASKPILKAGQITITHPKRAAAPSYPTITPILGEVEWGQSEPYNNLCPIVNGKRCVTGCVATAICQIMYAHKYPSKGIGSHTYISETNELALSIDFEATTYDWDNMLPNYYQNYDTRQATAVATLMHHVGVAANMDYDPDVSGANSAYSLQSLVKHFDYDAGIIVLSKGHMPEHELLNTLATDLQAGRPIFVSGRTRHNEGHAFVCDGMQSDGFLHINWGWNGWGNGYFATSALDPEQQGTGGSASDLAFSENVQFFTKIQPNKGGTYTQQGLIADKLKRYNDQVINRADTMYLSMINLQNPTLTPHFGRTELHIYDASKQLTSVMPLAGTELLPGYYYSYYYIYEPIPANLKAGEYTMEVFYRDSATNTISPITFKDFGRIEIPVTITEQTITFGEIPQSAIKSIQPMSACDVSNIIDTKSWILDMYSSSFYGTMFLEDEAYVRCFIHSNSSTSIIGSYVFDSTNSGAPGTISYACADVGTYYYGYTPINLTDIHLTIREGIDGMLLIEYHIELPGIITDEKVTIAQPTWYDYDISEDIYFYKNNVTFDIATPLNASQALAITKTLNHSDKTKISYLVSGLISQIHDTQEEIAQHKTAQFCISDDGTQTNQFYCNNTSWCYNTEFVTGKEITTGDRVVVFGPLQNYQSTIPQCEGYIYQHKNAPMYSITNLSTASEENKLYFKFESHALNFQVKIIDNDGNVITSAIIDFKSVSIKNMPDGTFTLWIRPVDEAQEYYIGDAVEAQFEINTKATGIEDLSSQQTVVLYDLMGRLVDRKQSGENRPFNVPADGIYIQRMGEKTTTIYINKR